MKVDQGCHALARCRIFCLQRSSSSQTGKCAACWIP